MISILKKELAEIQENKKDVKFLQKKKKDTLKRLQVVGKKLGVLNPTQQLQEVFRKKKLKKRDLTNLTRIFIKEGPEALFEVLGVESPFTNTMSKKAALLVGPILYSIVFLSGLFAMSFLDNYLDY